MSIPRHATSAILLAATLSAAPLRAQPEESPPAAAPEGATEQAGVGDLQYSSIDRATVRVFALHGVSSARVESASGVDRLIAVPEASHGSGVLVGRDVVLTARHVVEDAQLLAVWVPGQERAYPASLIWSSEDDDYAFVVIDGEVDASIELPASTSLRVRQTVHAVGYPLDARRTNPQSSRGIVSGVLPTGHIQLDMSLNPGNSGGPLIDEDETVVGIVVARGDVSRGVQGIGFAVPLEPIRASFDTHVGQGEALAAARRGLRTGPRGEQVAELVTLLAQVGASEIIREVIEVVENHRRGDILPRLRALGEGSNDPEVLALTAAYFWDVAAVILERNGGFMRASQLPEGPERTLARELLDRAVGLTRRAASLDPTIAARSPFVAHVLHYLAAVQVDDPRAPAPFVEPTPAPARAAAEQAEVPPAAEPPAAERAPRWFAQRIGVALPAQASPGFGIDGFAARASAVIRPWIGRVGVFGFAPQVSIDTSFGGWSGNFLASMQLQLTAHVRLGTEQLGAVLEGGWAPGIAFFPGPSEFTAAGWAAAAGLHVESVAFLLAWTGLNRPNGYSLHQFQVLFEVTP